jgi:hypothetical protein
MHHGPVCLIALVDRGACRRLQIQQRPSQARVEEADSVH